MMRFLIATALVFFCASAVSTAAPMSPTVIRKTLRTYVRAHPYAMVAVGVIDHGSETIYLVRGAQAKTRLEQTTLFQIGSITKVFTGTALAEMADKGQIRLSDPIQRYLPASVAAPSYRSRPITVLSLATHMSGLPGNPPNLPAFRPSDAYSTEMLDDALSATTLSRRPGTKWQYSNFAFAVLGQILTERSHLTYRDLIEQRILRPLGMNDTVVYGTAATRNKLAPAFEYGGTATEAESFGALDPAASIESDLKDMMTFLRANLQTPRGALGRAFALTQRPYVQVPERNMFMGLAWEISSPPTHNAAKDLSRFSSGWLEKAGNTDGYASVIALNHALDCGIVALTNVNDDDFQQVIAHAVSPETTKMPVLWALAPREQSPFSGTYRLSARASTFEIFKYRGNLYVWFPATGMPQRLTRLAANVYSWVAPKITFTFSRDRSGNVMELRAIQSGATARASKIK